MKKYNTWYNPRNGAIKTLPTEVPLYHLIFLGSFILIAALFVLGIAPLGLIILPSLSYLLLLRAWRLVWLLIALSVVIAIALLISQVIIIWGTSIFDNNPNAWWNNWFVVLFLIKPIALVTLGIPLLGAMSIFSLCSWEVYSEQVSAKLSKRGFIGPQEIEADSTSSAKTKVFVDFLEKLEGYQQPKKRSVLQIPAIVVSYILIFLIAAIFIGAISVGVDYAIGDWIRSLLS